MFSNQKVDIGPQKVDIQGQKVDIDPQKVDIQDQKVDIGQVIAQNEIGLTIKTQVHALRMYRAFGADTVWGRSSICELLNLKAAAATKLINKLLELELIVPVSGHGKGKYRFNQ